MTRFRRIFVTSLVALAVSVSAPVRPLPWLVWNASASVPIGLYAVRPVGTLHVGELVIVCPPDDLATFMHQRRYLPIGVPMLKQVAALPGQTVCRAGRTITVDGAVLGEALDSDSSGRPLPVWDGCQHLGLGSVFLMNWQSEHSFDGRYFGPLSDATIVGRTDPIWTREAK